MMSSVFLDATPVRPKMKGLGMFLRGLLDEVHNNPPNWLERVYIDETYGAEAKKRWPQLPLSIVRTDPAIIWEQWTLPKWLKSRKDAILFTCSDRVASSLAAKTVMFLFEIPDYRVHAAKENGAGYYSRLSGAYNLWSFRRTVCQLKRLITASHATAEDVVLKYAVPHERISVVHASIDNRFRAIPAKEAMTEARTSLTQGRRYVLHFSTGDPRDNSAVAFRAFAQACARIPREIVLLVVGTNDAAREKLHKIGKSCGISERVVMAPYLDDELLTKAYWSAEAYLDPTLYEGFGLQVLEAMATGVPVLASNVTSVPEVAGDAALLFDPYDIEGFAGGLAEMLCNEVHRKLLISKGKEQFQRFSWKKTLDGLSNVLVQGM